MRATPKVLCVAGALLAAGLPAGAAEAGVTTAVANKNAPVVLKTCSTKAGGTKLQVKLRFNMASAKSDTRVRSLRVRVSHPDGVGKFRSKRVRSVATTFLYESAKVDDRIGSAAWAERRGDRPAYNKGLRMKMGSVTTVVTFKLKNGKRTSLACSQQFPAR